MTRDADAARNREEVAYFMRRLYDKGLTTCSGGNISLRMDDDNVLITPSTLDKGELRPEQVLSVTMDGENLTPELKPTMEMWMHLNIFKARPDVRAIVHAHPVFATTFACTGLPIEPAMTPETIMVMGTLAWADFHPAGTRDLAETTAKSLNIHNVILMRHHGVLAVGTTLLKAFDRMEVTEMAAKMTWLARGLNASGKLNPEQIRACEALL